MPHVRLRGTLKRLADDRPEHAIDAATVDELLRTLEREHPALAGWVLDERGRLRPHINVFVNGERVSQEEPVAAEDRVDVLPAISGDDGMTELLIGTKKGLFVLDGTPDDGFELTSRTFTGEPVEYAVRDPRSGRLLAAVTSPFYGPKIFVTDDPGGDWEQAEGLVIPEGEGAVLARIWVIASGEEDGVLYAGGDPGVLFTSRDGGFRWELNEALWNHPTRGRWMPGAGGLCLHSIVPWPGDPDRLTVAVSAAGVWHTADGGATWSRGNAGLKAGYLPEETPPDEIGYCVHSIERSPANPERMYMQFHGGVYRSDDGGNSWTAIGDGLPSDFGFPLALDPRDPDSAYVIPLVAATDRVTPDGRVRVYETRDGGASWAPHGDGLPQVNAYLTILRQALTRKGDGTADGFELYFGATSGDVFGSADAGATWMTVATRLPPVFAVTAS